MLKKLPTVLIIKTKNVNLIWKYMQTLQNEQNSFKMQIFNIALDSHLLCHFAVMFGNLF